LSHVRIIIFGYDANVIGSSVSKNGVVDHAMSLLTALARERLGDAKTRPIFFVAHSLGGLILKEALHQSDKNQDIELHVPIFLATRGIVFLGTPHRGGNGIMLANMAVSVARAAFQNPNDELIRDLTTDAQTLSRIRKAFSQILGKGTLSVWSFYEELDTRPFGKVVPRDSAVLDNTGIVTESIHADHAGMAKFSSRDGEYKKVLFAIETLLEKWSQSNLAPTKQFGLKGQPEAALRHEDLTRWPNTSSTINNVQGNQNTTNNHVTGNQTNTTNHSARSITIGNVRAGDGGAGGSGGGQGGQGGGITIS